MTDTKIVEANVEARSTLIIGLNAIRTEAKLEGTISEAVDHALTGAALAVETAVLTGGMGSVVELNQELGKSWAETVNS